MDRAEKIVKRQDAVQLLEKAKAMEQELRKRPLRINSNTIILVSEEKCQRLNNK